MSRTVTVLNAMVRPLIESRLPDWVDARWFSNTGELLALAEEAEIGWFDSVDFPAAFEAARRARKLRWLNTVAAGVEPFPLDRFRAEGVILTNGAALNSITIAEYVVMGMLIIAKGYRQLARAQDRHEWLPEPPGTQELYESRALILGGGGIGSRVAALLQPFGVETVTVRRSPAPGALGADQWRARLGEFDWLIIAVPDTPETQGMVGAAELAAMKTGAAVINVARGTVIDQDALVASLRAGHTGAAFLDVTDPEPLPADHPLWGFDNVHITMHMSGRSQTTVFRRGAERFLANLAHFHRGEPLIHAVDLTLGY